jgi:hypothetical protein
LWRPGSAGGAGSYTVTSCRDLAGRAAPASDASGGWQSIGYGPGRAADDLCASGTPRLVASIGGPWSFPIPTIVEWRFTAPPDTYLEAFKLVYSGYTRPFNNENQGLIELWGSDSGRAMRIDGVGDVVTNVASRVGIHDRWAELVVACDGPAGKSGLPAQPVACQRHHLELGDDDR